ncbi:nitroreductase/quinone reductase family protein [Actinoplanes sp. URMC 104]|uniref:nitroreductase/quinone reductase family protein n=1 Tax=Actinoplanes sp. URMC 104 TaxID=3423409 RepID=UPI003F1D557D
MADEKPQTLAAQGLVNVIVRALLRTPGVARVIGRNLITLHVTGRRSGKHYAVPVAYVRHDGVLLIGTPFAWARNLRTGDRVPVDYLGRRTTADVRVHTAEDEVVADYAVIARENHQFAGFNKIALDAHGNPRPDDLHRAWHNGARVIRLTVN